MTAGRLLAAIATMLLVASIGLGIAPMASAASQSCIVTPTAPTCSLPCTASSTTRFTMVAVQGTIWLRTTGCIEPQSSATYGCSALIAVPWTCAYVAGPEHDGPLECTLSTTQGKGFAICEVE